jgi:hypothetical protein
MDGAGRGPERNGFFALWLVLRVCAGLLPPEGLAEAVHVQRLKKLERRLSSLSLPAPLRKAITAGLRELRTSSLDTPALVLQQLAAPAADTLGPVAGSAVTVAWRSARAAAREAERSA